MADFAEVLAAMDLATGSTSLAHYVASLEAVAAEIVATDPFLVALANWVRHPWQGTGKQLHDLLPGADGDKYWPAARGMNGKLKRVAPDLRKVGWTVTEVKADPQAKRAATWIIEPPTTASDAATGATA